ncbi:MAG: hypothetical protein Q9212_001775 [Teloschistes hypoglaucus]
MEMGFPEEMARNVYQSLRDTRKVDTPPLTTRMIGWLIEALIYLIYTFATLFSCVAAILWYTGRHVRARDWARRFRRCLNFITRIFTRAWNWLVHEQLSQLLDHLAFRITWSRYFLTHHLWRIGHLILQAGIVVTTVCLPPYLLSRIIFFFLKPPHERENNEGFDAAFAIAIHACIDHPIRIILATLTTLYCLNRLIGTNEDNNNNNNTNQECDCCLCKNKNASMESVDLAKLCESHRAAEYERRVQEKEREMFRQRWSPARREVAATLPRGEKFAHVPWHPLPLYDFSSVFPETEEVESSSFETARSVGSGNGIWMAEGVVEWGRSPSFTSTPSISRERKEGFL